MNCKSRLNRTGEVNELRLSVEREADELAKRIMYRVQG
jgi:hypothetical protein